MCLDVPENFDFPFTPYNIQHDFMKNLYEVLENRKLGIFESPTGTGKSLSIICGALRWLKDHNEREREEIAVKIQTIQDAKLKLAKDESDWISSQAEEIELTHKLNKLKIQQNEITAYDTKIEKFRNKTLKRLKNKSNFSDWINNKGSDSSENVLENVENNEDEMLLEETVDNDEEDTADETEPDKYKPVQVLICSRTHSQLSQLVGEISKSPFGNNSRAVSLASRQNYCINPEVSKLKNISLINQRCLDMQSKPKSNSKIDSDGKVLKRQRGSSCQCPYNKQQNIDDLRDLSLTTIQDVEDLVTNAKQLNACPYYASRKAAEDAQVVLVPYNTLLHKTTREASGIKLKNNVVIIDEAHNLLEALAQMYSCEINCAQLEEARLRLRGYKQKYSTRFSACNLLSINQLLFISSSLINLLEKNVKSIENVVANSEVYTIANFVLSAEIDNYNMFKLLKFCRDSKIAHKLHSFATKYPLDLDISLKKEEKSTRTKVQDFLASIENKTKDSAVILESSSSEIATKTQVMFGNPFLSFISFLEALTCAYEDGRIIVYRSDDKKQSKLQFLLLNPAEQFKEIVKEARSVIVAGGTMKPISEFKNRLFMGAGASSDRIIEFSCDHIIPPENILPLVITKGMNDENLLFNFENRFSMGTCLKEILQEVSKFVKGGIVVFFPSYKYESWVSQQLKGVTFEKPLFREPQDSGSVDTVLTAYAKAIRKPQSSGAILFSVVGGKLSEGLNFSDDLGRCVIVVGLPYANIYSPELKEKMLYLDKTEGKGAGQQFYEALCMKSVNQCIGRAVRHKNDYASVLLLDVRYDRSGTKNSLPGWIKRSLKTCRFVDGMDLINNVPENNEEWQKIEAGFRSRWNFPGCYGAIDGKHVSQVPPNCGSEYFN